MLTKLRNTSKGSVTKIVFGTLLTLLILSFAMWGTEDLVGIGKKQNTVATVGNLDISSKEFLSLYARQTEEIRNLLGSSLDIQKGRQFGYVDRALGSLVNRSLFNNQALDLGLSVSDLNVRDRIIQDSSFKDDLGQFSELIFRQLISESGYTEDKYVEGTRQDLARDQMVETLRSSFILPKIISDSIGSYNLEERSVNFVVVESKNQKIKNISEDEIKNYYEKNKDEFFTEEYRQVDTLLLDAATFAKNTTVTPDEVELLYEERQESLIKPERRYLKQILVQDENLANQIFKKIKKDNFNDIAKKLANLSSDDIDLGWNTKTELPEEIVDDVFQLKKNVLSKPLKSAFGWHIFKIIEIEKKKELKFEDVKKQFENELLIEKGKEAVYELQDEIEDSLAGGETLQEIAEKLEVKLISANSINNEGFNIDGSKNQEFQDTRILRAVFNQKENEEGNLIDIDDDNGLAVSIVKKIIKPRQMDFDESRLLVKNKVINEKQFEEAQKIAEKIKKRINASEKFANIAKKFKLELRGVAPFNRIRPDDSELPYPLIGKIFETELNKAVTYNRQKNEIFVVQVSEIINAYGKNKSDMISFNDRVEDDMSVDLLAQFSEVLRKKYKIFINDNVINQLN